MNGGKEQVKILDMRILKLKKDSTVPAEMVCQVKNDASAEIPTGIKHIKDVFKAIVAGEYSKLKVTLQTKY